MSSPVKAKLKAGANTLVTYKDGTWSFEDENKETQSIRSITSNKQRRGMNDFFSSTEMFAAQKSAENDEKKQRRTEKERKALGASPASSSSPATGLVARKQVTRTMTRSERQASSQGANAVPKTLFKSAGKSLSVADVQDAAADASHSSVKGSSEAKALQPADIASTPPPPEEVHGVSRRCGVDRLRAKGPS